MALSGSVPAIHEALEHFNDPQWLGEHSPLAAAYFLGKLVEHTTPLKGDPAQARGRLLQVLLLHAMAQKSVPSDSTWITAALQNDQPLRYTLEIGTLEQRMLYWEYVRPSKHQPKLSPEGIAAQLAIGRSSYFRLKKELPFDQLGQQLSRLVQPGLRLEQPPAVVDPLLDRETLLDEAKEHLHTHRQLALTGPVGSGKTSVGAALARGWTHGPVFWLTLQAGLNDGWSSCMWLLAHFLHMHDAPQLWLFLANMHAPSNRPVALEIAISDLATLRHGTPLLCFDNVEVLHTRPSEEREALQATLSTLSKTEARFALLAVGQHVALPISQHLEIPVPTPHLLEQILVTRAIGADPATQQQMAQVVQGNLHLLDLLSSLYRKGETLSALLDHVSGTPRLAVLVMRIEQWLEAQPYQLHLFRQLAVFRRAAPQDAWPSEPEQQALSYLLQLGLASRDEWGGIQVLSGIRQTVRAILIPAERATYHQRAALIRSKRLQYTAALYHYVMAECYPQAVRLWFSHSEQEIEAGQAATALALLKQVPLVALEPLDRQRLSIALAQLQQMRGTYDPDVLQSLATDDLEFSTLRPLTYEMRGDILQLNDTHAAMEAYQAGLDDLEAYKLARQEVRLHTKLAALALLLPHQHAQAKREGLLALYGTTVLLGQVEDEAGNYSQAQVHYREALAIATTLGDALRQAFSHASLAILELRWEDFDQALAHFKQAENYYRRIGDLLRLQRTRTNLAYCYLKIGNYTAALAYADEARQFFERINAPHWVSLNLANMAEAHLALGDLAQATTYAEQTLALHDAAWRPYGWWVLACVRLAQHDLSAAREYCERAIDGATASKDPILTAQSWRTLGHIWSAAQQWPRAFAAATYALQLYRELDLPREIARTQALLDQLP